MWHSVRDLLVAGDKRIIRQGGVSRYYCISLSGSSKHKHVRLSDVATFDVSYCSRKVETGALEHELSECVQENFQKQNKLP